MWLLSNSTILIVIPTVVLTLMPGALSAAARQAKPIVESADRGEWLFARRVLPLLKQKCLACHGEDPRGTSRASGYAHQGGPAAGRRFRPACSVTRPTNGKPFVHAVTRQDPYLQMPPKENDRLTGEQVETIRQWIAAGAPWPDEIGRQELRRDQWTQGESVEGVLVRTSGGQSERMDVSPLPS